MKIDLNIAGTPAEVRSQVADAAKAARRDDPHANIVMSAISDAIGRKLAGAGPDAQLVARVLVDISDATGLTDRIRDFAENPAEPRNEVHRAQQAAIVSERPAAVIATPVPVPVVSETDASAAAVLARRRVTDGAAPNSSNVVAMPAPGVPG